MPRPEDPFNPRTAALYHAEQTRYDVAHGDTIANAVTSIACGLIYIGDQIGRLVDSREVLVVEREMAPPDPKHSAYHNPPAS